MVNVLCIIMGAIDILAGIILLTTSKVAFMILGGLLIGKGVISLF